MTESTVFAPHEQLAAALLQHLQGEITDIAHDTSHLLRVWQNVRVIAATDGGDMEVLTAATLLHDCVHVAKDATDRAKASTMAAETAAHILQDLGWKERQVAAVCHAIQAHSFSAQITPETLEAQILQDADRLDALGHIGIARCFAVSGNLGRALYDPADPAARHRPLDDRSFALDHFQTKLLGLAQGFRTPTGRRLAKARHQALQDFFDAFLREVGGASASLLR